MSPQKTELSAAIKCKSGVLEQWVHWIVHPAAVASIGYESVQELCLTPVESIVHLQVCLDSARSVWALKVDEERADGIFVQMPMLQNFF